MYKSALLYVNYPLRNQSFVTHALCDYMSNPFTGQNNNTRETTEITVVKYIFIYVCVCE